MVAKTKICRFGLILKIVPLRSPHTDCRRRRKQRRSPRPCLPRTPTCCRSGLPDKPCHRSGSKYRCNPSRPMRDSRGVHHVVDERRQIEIQVDAVNGYRHFLAARPAERRIDIADRIHRGARHRMQIFRDLDADIAVPRVADWFPLPTTSSPAEAPSGTLTITSEFDPITTGAATSPIVTRGRSTAARLLPRMYSSPPVIAASGWTWEIWACRSYLCGLPCCS